MNTNLSGNNSVSILSASYCDPLSLNQLSSRDLTEESLLVRPSRQLHTSPWVARVPASVSACVCRYVVWFWISLTTTHRSEISQLHGYLVKKIKLWRKALVVLTELVQKQTIWFRHPPPNTLIWLAPKFRWS